jgi:hypothetical protein
MEYKESQQHALHGGGISHAKHITTKIPYQAMVRAAKEASTVQTKLTSKHKICTNHSKGECPYHLSAIRSPSKCYAKPASHCTV